MQVLKCITISESVANILIFFKFGGRLCLRRIYLYRLLPNISCAKFAHSHPKKSQCIEEPLPLNKNINRNASIQLHHNL